MFKNSDRNLIKISNSNFTVAVFQQRCIPNPKYKYSPNNVYSELLRKTFVDKVWNVFVQTYNPHNTKMFFIATSWIYLNMIFAANHIFDKDLRWEHKTNFTKIEAAGGDEEEEEEDDE